MDIFSEICLKRHHNYYRRMNLAASEFTQKAVSLRIGVGIGIVVERQALRFSITYVHQLVSLRTGRNCGMTLQN